MPLEKNTDADLLFEWLASPAQLLMESDVESCIGRAERSADRSNHRRGYRSSRFSFSAKRFGSKSC
jgi:hypothetical protein